MTSNEKDFITPMMKQYMEIKNLYNDCLIMFRLGDFYELFMDDAKIGSEILDITLTSRDRGSDGRIPMCGVPFHAIDSYLPKLVRAGYKVAICEQIGDTKSPGLVKREVVRIVTPGTILNEGSLDKKENNYIVGIHIEGENFGIAISDLSTGTFYTAQYPYSNYSNFILNQLPKYSPSECVLSKEAYDNPDILSHLSSHKSLNIFPFLDWDNFTKDAKNYLERHFGLNEISSFGIEQDTIAQKASAGLLGYLSFTQKDRISHISKISVLEDNKNLLIDRSSLINLEVFNTIRENKRQGSLIDFLDYTVTSMGGRMLRNWLLKPLVDKDEIEKRYDAVEELNNDFSLRENIQNVLKEIYDLERLISRISTGVSNPKDLISLKISIKNSFKVRELINKSRSELLKKLYKSFPKEVLKLSEYLDQVLLEEVSFDPKTGGLINDGFDKEIDKIRSQINESKSYLSDLESIERKRTGISSLKLKYNQVFGYYIEITKSNLSSVPSDYDRKQTLVNAERFITPQLKKHEDIILNAQERINELEYELYLKIIDNVLSKTKDIQILADIISTLDCLCSFSQISMENDLVRPLITKDGIIDIKDGRHPMVEESLSSGDFVPNDTYLDKNDNQLIILTGPNMAGKSVYIRQVAIIVLMSQIGCFVPVSYASIGLVDRIFVRSGASDVISKGLSTFMVEMVETANILNNATKNSLIVMDEIGRGTSTYDGISIAWSIAEYLVTCEAKPKTLFATHYHELQELEEKFPNQIKNFQVLVKENGGEPVFLHKVGRGGANHSYGIAVASLAGVPKDICTKAYEILNFLESKVLDGVKEEKSIKGSIKNIKSGETKSLYENINKNINITEIEDLLSEITKMDISNTTPLEALNLLSILKKRLNVKN